MGEDEGDEFVEEFSLVEVGTLGGRDLFGVGGRRVEDFFGFAFAADFADVGLGYLNDTFVNVFGGGKGVDDAGAVGRQSDVIGYAGGDGVGTGCGKVIDGEDGLTRIGLDGLESGDFDFVVGGVVTG